MKFEINCDQDYINILLLREYNTIKRAVMPDLGLNSIVYDEIDLPWSCRPYD